MIQIPRISITADTVEKVRNEFNNILAQIQDQVNRDLNNLESGDNGIMQAQNRFNDELNNLKAEVKKLKGN